ncbi:DUF2975 domain-containing protein [Cytophagales bacterium LB-30]|uniref:DUF2975 domain-containing protein n=1 Tax=Shiella aurantiaca TaxID=3058365 RepID=A0ABT8F0H4_9BACT|nr:DUF2975 domain-containing protein [Shiella aurantiaca]MDN4163942.1 DUF2975 domain-containing protein [Shiella aurantiaca]
MQTVKIVAKILFYISGLLAGFYLVVPAYSALSLLTGWWLELGEGGNRFYICYPFTETHFLIGQYHLPYIVFNFLLPLLCYGLFFWLLAQVFRVFFQPKLFTEVGVAHLSRFYQANFLVPSLVTILMSFFVDLDNVTWVLIGAHAIMGVFAYFLAAIFRQGVHLQHEQDLFV